MDENTKAAAIIFTSFIVFFLSIAGIGGMISAQLHRQKMETYNVVSKCRQQSPQNADAVCGPLPKFN